MADGAVVRSSSRGIVLLTTGGTIAATTSEDGVVRQESSGRDLLGSGAAPTIGTKITVHDLLAVDSSQLTPQDWQRISAAIRTHIAAGATGVVVTHGTDTLEETALWLALTCAAPVPVVLTGAQRAADDPAPDGPANLRDALAVAADPRAGELGVVVCFAGQVYPAAGLRKLDLDALAGFGGVAPVGHVRDGVFTSTATTPRLFTGTVTAPTLPRVDIVPVYPGADATALHACVRAGARGVVLESVGAGNASHNVVEAVSKLVHDGVDVVVTTRVPHGVMEPRYAAGRRLADAGAVMIPHLRSGQARVLLMAALSTGAGLADLAVRVG